MNGDVVDLAVPAAVLWTVATAHENVRGTFACVHACATSGCGASMARLRNEKVVQVCTGATSNSSLDVLEPFGNSSLHICYPKPECLITGCFGPLEFSQAYEGGNFQLYLKARFSWLRVLQSFH